VPQAETGFEIRGAGRANSVLILFPVEGPTRPQEIIVSRWALHSLANSRLGDQQRFVVSSGAICTQALIAARILGGRFLCHPLYFTEGIDHSPNRPPPAPLFLKNSREPTMSIVGICSHLAKSWGRLGSRRRTLPVRPRKSRCTSRGSHHGIPARRCPSALIRALNMDSVFGASFIRGIR